jgi:hypothetical protein
MVTLTPDEVMNWLKEDFKSGRGHALSIYQKQKKNKDISNVLMLIRTLLILLFTAIVFKTQIGTSLGPEVFYNQ